ncbi:hypothetical protein FQA39_LY05289 [Lamprigera yunnana]|nr:hypothetical protein FQA39_LY05289 [Lamprigera yunnana]
MTHRSLLHKHVLGNLFLNDDLHVKIGDFGLVARIAFDGETKKTLYGTTNYISPEILIKKGYIFEVDVWSIRCIMYSALFGRPSFKTNSFEETYTRIIKCDYTINSNISAPAKNMIMMMLQSEPKLRPIKLVHYKFLTTAYTPALLPSSCLTMAPRFDQFEKTALLTKGLQTNRNRAAFVESLYALRSQAREIVANAIEFMTQEAKEGVTIAFSNFKERILAATKIRQFTHRRVASEVKEISQGKALKFSSPKKNTSRQNP